MWSYNQHSGIGSRPTDSKTTWRTGQWSSVELRGDLSAGSSRCHPCHAGGSQAFVRPSDIETNEHEDANQTFIATFKVHNPAIFNKSIKEVAELSYPKFVISRLWRNGAVSIPTSEKVLKEDDRLLITHYRKRRPTLTILFGEQEAQDWNKKDIDWNAIDSQLISKHIVVSRPEINGKKLGSLRLRNSYGINISRVMRSGVQLLATPGLILQLGDRLTV